MKGINGVYIEGQQARRSCEIKRVYRDEVIAMTVAKKRSLITGHVIEPYKCRFCGKWHIGHPKRTDG